MKAKPNKKLALQRVFYTFVNNRGEIITLRGDNTLRDLAVSGFEFRLEPKGAKIKDGWWASTGV